MRLPGKKKNSLFKEYDYEKKKIEKIDINNQRLRLKINSQVNKEIIYIYIYKWKLLHFM